MWSEAQLGDRQAFGELVERFQPTVYAIALARLRNPTEAQELAQEVFVHGMRKLPQLRDVAVLRRLAAADHGAHGHQPADPQGPAAEGRRRGAGECRGGRASPLEELVRTEQAAELYRGLDRLKPVDRATLVAFYLRGRSLKQMSREFETPVGTIKRRLHVARNRLKKVLEQPAGARLPRTRSPRQLVACI